MQRFLSVATQKCLVNLNKLQGHGAAMVENGVENRFIVYEQQQWPEPLFYTVYSNVVCRTLMCIFSDIDGSGSDAKGGVSKVRTA